MSAADPMPVGDLEWDSKPGRPTCATRVYTIPTLRPRQLTAQPSAHVPHEPELLDDATREALAEEKRRWEMGERRSYRARVRGRRQGAT